MDSTVTDPIYPGGLGSISSGDTVKAKLLICAMLDHSLSHNSPLPKSIEASQGIFTNYIQFMDNVARNWGTIRTSENGLQRLKKIHEKVLQWNKEPVIDPVYVKNHGTVLDYDTAEQKRKRKNYAFYEGYTRLHFDFERSSYETDQKCGAGVIFRISDNVELYEANMADTFNIFDKPFLQGSDISRRIIIPAKDSIFEKLDNDGLWLKGSDTSMACNTYYIGISSVRLPVQYSTNIKIDTAFALSKERKNQEDPTGELIGGVRNSIVKIYELPDNDGIIDTIENSVDPELLLHGQARRIECDSSYFSGLIMKFKIEAEVDSDTGKISLKDQTNYGITLVDTATIDSVIRLFVLGLKRFSDGVLKPVTIMRASALSRKIALKDAQNGFQYISDLDGRAYCSINVEGIENPGDIKKFLPRNYRENGEFSVFGSDRIKVHKRDELALSDIIWDNSKEYTPYEWDNFVTEVLNNNTLWLEYKYVPSHKYDIFFRYQNKKEQKLKKEEHAVIDVGFDYDNKFVELYTKISSLCDCKSGAEKEECKSEAYRLTEQYFQMWGYYAMNDESWGVRNKRCQNQYSEHVKSGWMCFQWAYNTQYYLNLMDYTQFSIEWSAVADMIGINFTVYHSWITINLNSCSEMYMHFDPWAENKIDIYNETEHQMVTEYGKRNFIGVTNLKKGALSGNFINNEGDTIYVEYQEFWDRW